MGRLSLTLIQILDYGGPIGLGCASGVTKERLHLSVRHLALGGRFRRRVRCRSHIGQRCPTYLYLAKASERAPNCVRKRRGL